MKFNFPNPCSLILLGIVVDNALPIADPLMTSPLTHLLTKVEPLLYKFNYSSILLHLCC